MKTQSRKQSVKHRRGYKSQLKQQLGTLAIRNGELLKQMDTMSTPEQVRALVNLVVQAAEDVYGEGASKKIFDRMSEITTNQIAEAAKKSVPAGEQVPDSAPADTMVGG